jgi:acetoin utilization protein AcuC
MENPLFPGLFERAATAVGGSILAAKVALGGGLAFHPAGGTHHGRADRASGFCYFNDPVFAILTLLEGGLRRVLYVDLDAHHGDGVQDAFEADQRVFTVSIHEDNRWPHTGPLEDFGGGQARNLPVPRGFNDSELAYLLEAAVLPLLKRFDPEALVITCGADGLAGDPLSKLELSNRALWEAVETLVGHCGRAIVLGGGGYNPWTVVRCWTGLWGRLSGQAFPTELPPEAQQLLSAYECDLVDEEDIEECWLRTLVDQPNTGPIRVEVEQAARFVLQ